jgi:hypothetical protein
VVVLLRNPVMLDGDGDDADNSENDGGNSG